MEYLVNVSVHQVAGLTLGEGAADNPNPYVIVKVLDESHETNVVNDASTCTFGHTFCISKHKQQHEFESSDVEVIVMHSKGYGRTQELGHCIFSLQKIRRQDNNMVTKSWFPCVKKGEPAVTAGFVQLSIGAYSPQDIVPRSFGGGAGGDGEGQCVQSRVVSLPVASKSKNLFQLMVRVYRAEDLRRVSGVFADGCDPFVQVDFYGTSQKTEIQKGTSTPTWNEEIRVPLQFPCWDNSINVFLKSTGASGMSEELLGECCLHLDELLEREMPPTWFNFYHAPKEASNLGMAAIFAGKIETEESAFAGRLLLSACSERSENPTLSKQAAPTPREPSALKRVIWADFYEICMDINPQYMPNELYVSIAIGAGEEIKSEHAEKHSLAFIWDGESGRLEEQLATMVDKDMCADIIVSVYAKFPALLSSSWERYMFTRIKAADVWNWDTKPKWYEMQKVEGCAGPKNAGFALLNISVGSHAEKPKKRPPREKIVLTHFRFRAKIYQATDLPWKSKEGGTDPFIVVFFGAAMLKSDVVPWTINPIFNQVLESDVELPARAEFRPEIIIYVLNHLEDGVDPLAIYRYNTTSPGALPEVWKGPPVWLNLDPMPGSQPVNGRILVAFELAPATPRGSSFSANGGPVEDSEGGSASMLNVATVDCRADFFVMGIRMFETGIVRGTPVLQVAWGRKEEDRGEPKKQKFTDGGEGREGEFNFKSRVGMNCALAKDPLYQEWLEIKVFDDENEGSEDGVLRIAAFACVHMGPFMPWHTYKKRKELAKGFEIHMQEGAAEHGDGYASEDDKTPHSGMGFWKHAKDLLKNSEKALCHSMGWDTASCEASNIRKLDWLEYVNLNAEDEEGNKNELRKRASALKAKEEASNAVEEDGKEANIFAMMGLEEDEELRQSGGDMEGYTNILANFCEFSWPIAAAGDSLDKHPDLDGDFEHAVLQHQELPYHSTPIYIGTEWGEPRQVGVLKYCLRIAEKEKTKNNDAATLEAAAAFDNKIQEIETMMSQSKDLVIRAYVLSADGLIPHSGSSDISTFVQSRVEKEANTMYTFHDSMTVRHHTTHPQFHSCHTFSHCHFPGNCILEHTIFELPKAGMLGGGGTEEPIGHTQIDLEDRWFSQRYREMVQADIVPIESRRLSHEQSVFGKGHLRVWVDIMTNDLSRTRKPAVLPSTQPVPFQMRVIIWKVRGVDNSFKDGKTTADIFVSGKHTLDDKTELSKRSDTHLNANDGIGTFNELFIYDIFIPCRDPQLLLRVVDDGYFDDDPIGEVTFDFTQDFYEARKGNCTVELQRGLVNMTHASFPGEIRCKLDVEVKLLPLEEALMDQVAEGCFDPDDPHLKAHRGLLGNMQVLQNLASLGNGLLMMGKYMLYMKIAAVVAGGLFTFITGIVMMSK